MRHRPLSNPFVPESIKIAAQVVIASPSVDAQRVTAQNVHQVRSDTSVSGRIVKAFTALGFTPGPLVGNSFSIEASPEVFQDVFGILPHLDPDGRVRDGAPDAARTGAALNSLPLEKLPPTLRALVSAVIFSEPPAFGPGVMP